ncbi:hypothetical protein IFM89_005543 [Coptis chinensis]|uniref:Uncharacterized protein n=1 Tax=Coptis chinensis TaxID=261450 RepID=A0A835LLG9_9MAGN|nr:hypothetical protein IFM89_005543 [Coptis chinensis]
MDVIRQAKSGMGENICVCFVNAGSRLNRSLRSSSCSCSMPYTGISLPGMSFYRDLLELEKKCFDDNYILLHRLLWVMAGCVIVICLADEIFLANIFIKDYIKLSEGEKNRKLNDLLDALDFNQVVIFMKSVSGAAELNKLLWECIFPSICIHSRMHVTEERLALISVSFFFEICWTSTCYEVCLEHGK